jgi:hypothetical protein
MPDPASMAKKSRSTPAVRPRPRRSSAPWRPFALDGEKLALDGEKLALDSEKLAPHHEKVALDGEKLALDVILKAAGLKDPPSPRKAGGT